MKNRAQPICISISSSGTLCAHTYYEPWAARERDMDGLTLLVVFALASTLALAGARAVLGAVLHLMNNSLVPAPVRRDQDVPPAR